MSVLDTVAITYERLASRGMAAAATLTRTVPGAYNPTTGGNGAATVTNASVKATLDASGTKKLGFKFGEGLVQAGDIMATIPAKGLPFTPQPGDKFTLGSAYTVAAVQPTWVGAVPVLYDLLVRK